MKLQRRTIIKVGFFLLAGAIINVAVAWGCASWVDVVHARVVASDLRIEHPDKNEGFGGVSFSRLGSSQVILYYFHFDGSLVDLTSTENDVRRAMFAAVFSNGAPPYKSLPYWADADGWISQVRDDRLQSRQSYYGAWASIAAAGWPCRSMTCKFDRVFSPVLWEPCAHDGSNIPVGQWNSQPPSSLLPSQRVLPCEPLWPGFAINTIFYAAILYALFAVPGAVRRRLRHKRGQCASCGYSLRGLSGDEKCPECGAKHEITRRRS